MVITYNGKIYFYPKKGTVLGCSRLPVCFMFDAKMRIRAAQVGSLKLYEKASLHEKTYGFPKDDQYFSLR